MKITLEYPITVEGREVAEIDIRRPKTRDFKLANKKGEDDMQNEIRLFSNLTSLPPEAVEDMDFADYKKLQDALRNFIKAES